MKNILYLVGLYVFLFGFTSCESDRWEEVELDMTPVLYVLNTDGGADKPVYAYSIYYELNSLIVWNTKYITSGSYEISEYSNLSTDEEYLISFKTITENLETIEDEEDGNEDTKKLVRTVRLFLLRAVKDTGAGTLEVYEQKWLGDVEIQPSTLVETYNVNVSETEMFKSK